MVVILLKFLTIYKTLFADSIFKIYLYLKFFFPQKLKLKFKISATRWCLAWFLVFKTLLTPLV